MSKKIRMRVSYYKQHGERIIVIKVYMKPTPTTVVQVYIPTTSAGEETENTYDAIKEIIQLVKGEENLTVK